MARGWRRLAIGTALLLAAPGGAQSPEPSFSLQADRSFAPGERVVLSLTSQNVDQLEFRLYRVQDPVALFRQLRDYDSFGGAAPPAPRGRTPIERLERWKARTRYAIRRLLHDQFGDEERAALRAWWRRGSARGEGRDPGGAAQWNKKNGAAGVEFAEVPLLNPERLVRRWTVLAARGQNPWDTQRIEFDSPGPGLFVVEAAARGLRAATLVSVTSWVLIEKSAPGRVLAWLVERESGRPVSGVPLTLLGDGAVVAGAVTDGEGLAEIAVRGEGFSHLLLVAARGPAAAMVQIGGWAVQPLRRELAVGYVYTDRPIYRPGDAIGIRAILRGEDERGWTLPAATEVDCEIQGPDGEAVDRRRLKVSRYGTVSTSWRAPRNAALGYYSILLRAGESTEAGSFQIEEYRKPEFEVKVTGAAPRVLMGGRVAFTIEARYFFGEPVAGSKVSYSVRRSRAWHWFSGEFDPEDWESDDSDFYGHEILQKEAVLDAEGRAMVTIPAPLADRDAEYRLLAKVTDASRREVTGQGMVLATVGSYALAVELDRWLYGPGEEAQVRVRSWNYDRSPRPNTPFVVELGARRVLGVTDGDGQGRVTIPVTGEHSVQLRAWSRTPEGRTVEAEATVWIVAGGFRASETASIEIVSDRKWYRPGETARLWMVTGVSGASVLVTVECRGVLRRQRLAAPGPSFVYELPISAEYMPNVYVTAVAIQDGRFLAGSKNLKVPSDKLLNVTLQSSKPEYQPGEPARFTIEARDALGRPVEGEFSLGVVDEAVYGVAAERLTSIARAFHGRQYDRVNTSSSLSFYFFGSAGKRGLPLAGGQNRRRILAQMKPPRVFDPRQRRDFRDTAFWAANVETNAAGRAEVRFQFPDTITAWRATARGVTVDTRVGSAVTRVVTRKDLILRTIAPRFLTEGDEVTVTAIVNNYLPGDREVTVTMEAQGLALLNGKQRTGLAPAKAETAFDFRVRAGRVETAKILLRAIAKDGADAMEIELPVGPYGVEVTQVWSGVLGGAGEQAQEILFPPGSARRAVEVRTLPSLAGALFGALEYLTSYPYGCTEQTLSSFVPNAVVMRALRELKLPAQDRRRVERQTAAGLARLASLQHPDGGWGFGASDDSSAVMTASVVMALEDLGQWGPVNREAARAWLKQALERDAGAAADIQAFWATALRDPEAIQQVWPLRERMSNYGWALLARVADPDRAAELRGRLIQAARVTDTEAHWEMPRDPLLDIDVDTSAETTALVMQAWLRAEPASPLMAKAARWLVRHRREGHYWVSTKQTAAVVAALTGFLKQSGELDPKLAVEVRSNGALVWNKELVQADALSPHPAGVRIVPAGDKARISLSARGQGQIYWSITATHYEDRPGRDQRQGLAISREYFRQLPGGALVAFDGLARTGEVIVSRIRVYGNGVRWLAVEDPIPAGAEWIRDDVDFGGGRELRDDRAVRLVSKLDDWMVFDNRMKVLRPGVFRINPARVTLMYQPGVMASTAGARMEVRP